MAWCYAGSPRGSSPTCRCTEYDGHSIANCDHQRQHLPHEEDYMSRALITAVGVAALQGALAAIPTPSQAQYDLNTCSGNYSYCLEWARRRGQPGDAACQRAYQECMRRGSWSRPEPYSPNRPGPGSLPIERK